MIDTGALTDHMIATLAEISWLELGDGIAPEAGGWFLAAFARILASGFLPGVLCPAF